MATDDTPTTTETAASTPDPAPPAGGEQAFTSSEQAAGAPPAAQTGDPGAPPAQLSTAPPSADAPSAEEVDAQRLAVENRAVQAHEWSPPDEPLNTSTGPRDALDPESEGATPVAAADLGVTAASGPAGVQGPEDAMDPRGTVGDYGAKIEATGQAHFTHQPIPEHQRTVQGPTSTAVPQNAIAQGEHNAAADQAAEDPDERMAQRAGSDEIPHTDLELAGYERDEPADEAPADEAPADEPAPEPEPGAGQV